MRVLLLCLLLLAPVALAQAEHEADEVVPTERGNDGSAATEQETIETGPGIVWGLAVLVGLVGFVGLTWYLVREQDKWR